MKKSTRCILKNVAFFVFAGFLLAMTACETTQAQTKKNEMEADVLLEQGKVAFEAGNYEKAFTLFSKSAELGNVSAQCLVGVMYLGLGDEPNYQKANEWLTKASRAGNAVAQNILGLMYWQGLGVKPDYQKAFDLFTKSAEQGYFLAQLHLGLMYEKGLGVKPNMQKATEWYNKVGVQNSDDAQEALKQIH